MQAIEQLSPNFLHPHELLQPFWQEQKIIFNKFAGAGGCVVRTGTKKLSFKTQPQSPGLSLFPSHYWTW